MAWWCPPRRFAWTSRGRPARHYPGGRAQIATGKGSGNVRRRRRLPDLGGPPLQHFLWRQERRLSHRDAEGRPRRCGYAERQPTGRPARRLGWQRRTCRRANGAWRWCIGRQPRGRRRRHARLRSYLEPEPPGRYGRNSAWWREGNSLRTPGNRARSS